MSFLPTMMESLCIIQRPTIGRDESYGVTQDPFVTIASDQPCCVSQGSPSLMTLYAQMNTSIGTTVYFATDPAIQANFRLIITDRLGVTRYYLAKGTSQPLGRGHTWYVSAQLIDAPTVL